MKDLSKLKQRWYFLDEEENSYLIGILQYHVYGEYIKIFDIEVMDGRFRFNTLWRLDARFGNSIRKFDVIVDSVLYDEVYDFLIQMGFRHERILKLREIGL